MNSPLYIGGELWNDLPANVRNLQDIDELKITIKNGL